MDRVAAAGAAGDDAIRELVARTRATGRKKEGRLYRTRAKERSGGFRGLSRRPEAAVLAAEKTG